jgi:putative oxidoreductase
MTLLRRSYETPGLLILRALLGFLVGVHGLQKLTTVGPEGFGHGLLAELGVPIPVVAGYVVTFAELVGGAFLILGLLTRLAALVLTIDLVVAIFLVKVNVGLIGMKGAGAELELAYIAGFLALLLMGPGRLSLDRAIGLEPRRPGSAEELATAS